VLPYIFAGLTTGSIFALAGVGLVLTYKTSGIFNFAHGAQASISAFLFYYLHTQHGMAWPLTAAICVFVVGPIIGLALELVAGRLPSATLPTRVLATVGILLVIQGALELLYHPGPDREIRQYLPTKTWTVDGTPIELFRVIIFAIALVAVAVLTVFLRYSRTGLAMRAVVDNSELLDVVGISPVRTRRFAWLIGSTMAAGSGVLLAPLLPLDATTLTFLVITAFGAAAIGGFTNLPMTYLGGLAIGVGQALLQKYFFSSTGLTAGLSASLPFLILFVLLLVAPRLRRPSAIGAKIRTGEMWRPPGIVRMGGAAILVLVLVLVPQFAGIHLADWTRFLAYTILFLSLGLLVRMSGQVSLGHVSFMAVGVVAFAHVVNGHHWPWLLALLFAGAVAAPIGALLAIPAIRFPGLYLALATLGFGILLQQMFYNEGFMFGGLGIGVNVRRPQIGGLNLTSDRSYYYVVLAITVLIGLLVAGINSSRLGRLLRAMTDSPAGLSASGASINVSRVLVFCISASLAAVAGVLDAGTLGVVGGDGYQPILSVQLFALIMLTLGGVPWYAVTAAAGQILIPAYISSNATVGYALTLIFGASAVLYAVTPPSSRRLPRRVRRLIDRLDRTTAATDSSAPPGDASAEPPAVVPTGAGLLVERITVGFGGHLAVDDISISAPAGKIVGLIGPNGAGKTTTFNACSGLVRPTSGHILLDGRAIDRLGPPLRARRGLGRTFQQMELFDTLTTQENVALGCESSYAGWNPLDHLFSWPRQRAHVRRRTEEAMELCGISDIAGTATGSLSTGQRRLVELARCVAGPFHVLLLDEPSSGLDHVETERFGAILSKVVEMRRVGILLIEHDMTLVNSLCAWIYVIDFGKPIFEGTVAEVARSALVRAAYLGEDDGLALSERDTDSVTA
jgi:ABC-type branched-subunit amino acid transport system ATPase component/branched-subunit amino acid ABC-type transport system permease component